MARQLLHAALWSSYLREMGSEKGTGKLGLPRDTSLPMSGVLQTLSAQGKKGRALVGLALWNRLPAHIEKKPSQPFDGLLLDALGLGVDEARRRKQDQGGIFPPFADPTVTDDVRWELADDAKGRSVANLDICVLTPLAHFPSFRDPRVWTRKCDLFWGELELIHSQRISAMKSGGRDERLHRLAGSLHLPGQTRGSSLDVTLDVRTTNSHFGSRIDFWMIRNTSLEIFRGYVSIEKEQGRPGATRIKQHRELRFARGGLLRKVQRETLAYWLQTDAVCLAIP